MAKLPRIVIPNTPHHVTQRGNRRQQTFFCEDDYADYLMLMSHACKRFGVKIWAYCLMPNHIHLVAIPTLETSLRYAIGTAHEYYSKQINYRHGWKGHLWQGRFFSVPMDEEYLAACVRYVELNPVRAGMCVSPFDYKWSSARAHLNQKNDNLGDIAPMLERFPDWEAYLAMTAEDSKIESIRRHSTTGRPLGSDAFVRSLEEATGRELFVKPPGPKKAVPKVEITKTDGALGPGS